MNKIEFGNFTADSSPFTMKFQRIVEDLFVSAKVADETATILPATWTLLQEAEMLIAPFPAELGGSDLGNPSQHRELCDILRTIGAADLSLARLYEGHVNAVLLMLRYGTRAQIEELANDVAKGALSGVWAAEDAIGLRISRSGDTFQLDGRKIFASGAGFVTRPIVTATAPEGQALCLLRMTLGERADISGWTALGMRSTATGTVELSGIELPGDAIIGGYGDFMEQPYFSGGAWRFCAAHLGATERLVDLFRIHLVSRKRADDPYQLQRLALCIASAKTARFWVEEAASRMALGQHDAQRVVAFTNLTRMVTERAALDVMEHIQRGAGLGAFLRPHPIERISRDLGTYLRQPVPDLAMSDGARTWLSNDILMESF